MNKRQRQLVNTLADMVTPVIEQRTDGVLAGSARVGAPGLSVRMADSSTAEIMIYGRIGGSMWDEGITAAAMAETLNGIKAPNIHVRINSGGGDVFEGVAIHTLLRRHAATVTTFVDGLAASAASFIAMAGDRVVIARPGMMMLHDGMTGTYGNPATHRRTADLLDKVSDVIADVYAARAGEDIAFWRDVMSRNGEDGTWYTSAEAVEIGLADEVTDPDEDDQPVSALMAQWSNLLTRAPESVRAHLDAVLAETGDSTDGVEPDDEDAGDGAEGDGAPEYSTGDEGAPGPADPTADSGDHEGAGVAPSGNDLGQNADVNDAAEFAFAMRMTHWQLLNNNGRRAHRAAA